MLDPAGSSKWVGGPGSHLSFGVPARPGAPSLGRPTADVPVDPAHVPDASEPAAPEDWDAMLNNARELIDDHPMMVLMDVLQALGVQAHTANKCAASLVNDEARNPVSTRQDAPAQRHCCQHDAGQTIFC